MFFIGLCNKQFALFVFYIKIFQMTFGELRVKALEAKESKGRDLIHVHAVSSKL